MIRFIVQATLALYAVFFGILVAFHALFGNYWWCFLYVLVLSFVIIFTEKYSSNIIKYLEEEWEAHRGVFDFAAGLRAPFSAHLEFVIASIFIGILWLLWVLKL